MRKIEKIGFRLEHWQKVAALLMLYDVIAVNFAYFLALWVRFDCAFSEIEAKYLEAYLKFVPIYTIACVAVFVWLKMYNSIWRFASFPELLRVLMSTAVSGVFHVVAITLIFCCWVSGFLIDSFCWNAAE